MKNVHRCLPARLEVIKSVQPGQISLISQLAATPDAEPPADLIGSPLHRNPAAPSGRPFNRHRRNPDGPFPALRNLVANLLNQLPGMRPAWLADELTAARVPAHLDIRRLKFLPQALWLVEKPNPQ